MDHMQSAFISPLRHLGGEVHALRDCNSSRLGSPTSFPLPRPLLFRYKVLMMAGKGSGLCAVLIDSFVPFQSSCLWSLCPAKPFLALTSVISHSSPTARDFLSAYADPISRVTQPWPARTCNYLNEHFPELAPLESLLQASSS